MNIINKNHNILHTDIKPENILVVGVNNKDQEIIKRLEGHKELQNCLHYKKKKSKDNKNFDKKKNLKKIIRSITFDDIEDKYDKYSYSDASLVDDIEMIDDKYVTNIVTKLSDFGLCRKLNYSNFDIQTRHYRAPEIILGYKYDETCDLWSVGCLFYELITGKVLFDPEKRDGINTNRAHIYDMVCLFGKIPDDLVNSSMNKKKFFRHNGLLKGINKIEFNNFYNIMEICLDDRKIEISQKEKVISFLKVIFNYNPKDRSRVVDILKHPLFQK